MIQVFYGDNRIKIQQEIEKFFGNKKYEIIEGANLTAQDLPSVFLGKTLFDDKRAILLKDVSENTAVWDKIGDYVKTEHQVVIWETKIDKRTTGYKELQKAGVKMTECKMMEPVDRKIVFDIFETAFRDGAKAVKMCEQIENTNDPFMFVGLLVSQAIKKYEWRAGTKEKRVLKELSKLDMQMKTTSLPPWTLVKSFLLQVSQF